MDQKSLFDAFVPSASRTDLSGTMRDIESRLLPDKAHHLQIRREHPLLSDFDIERSILRNFTRDKMGQPGAYGLYFWQHFLLFMKELMPKVVITPSFVDESIAMEIALSERCDLLNLIGAKSTGKSCFMACACLTFMAIDPDYTRVYVAAPFKNVADFTIWSEMRARFDEIKENHADVFPEMRETPTAKLIQFNFAHAKAGRIDLIGLDNVGKLQGTKSRDQTRGYMLLAADEIALFQRQDFLQVLDNVTGNDNFFGFDGCNFKSILTMDGILCNPRTGEYGDLHPDKDHLWRSQYNSITLRLDGHLCPNVIENREIYPFLLTERKRVNMEVQHTKLGPKYLEQIRSFPHQGVEDDFVLTMSAIRSGGAFDNFWWREQGQWTRVAALDPGWQGDPCRIGAFEFGPARVQAHDGSVQYITIFRPLGPIETLKVQVGIKADAQFLSRLAAVSNGPIMLKEGREVTMDMQIAVQTAEFLRSNQVDRQNFAFDSSCRGSITQELGTVLGPGIMVYDLVNLPTEMVVNSEGGTAKECYRNLRSELYFTLALGVSAGQLRDGGLIMDALGQACRHRVVQTGIKAAIEPKAKYKEMNQGKSPDSSDVLTMGFHAARRRGMPLGFTRSVARNTTYSIESLRELRPRPGFAKLSR